MPVQIADVQAGKDFSLFLTYNQEVLACGQNSKGQLGLGDSSDGYYSPTKIPILGSVIKIECNEGAIALDNQGQMFIWGPVSKDNCFIVPQKI